MLRKAVHIGVQKVLNQLNQAKGPSLKQQDGEILYRQINLNHMFSQLSLLPQDNLPLKILDGGSGTGRLTVELAKAGHQVTGIDLNKPSMDEAKERAAAAGVSIEYILGDLYESIKKLPSNYFDAGISVGVLYACAQYREIIKEFSRVIKNDGILLANFRSRFYFITTFLRKKDFKNALYVAKHSEGLLKQYKAPTYYNWHSEEDVLQLYRENNLEILKMRPVGLFSGQDNDGMAAILDVHDIPGNILDSPLFELEAADWQGCTSAGRFIMAIGRVAKN